MINDHADVTVSVFCHLICRSPNWTCT